MTLDNLIKELYAEAFRLEEDGAYREAAEQYALRAFAGLLKAEFRSGRSMRIACAHMQEAISADVRGGNRTRANHLFNTVLPLYEPMIEETDDPILEGLLHEWLGDAHFILTRGEATRWYRDAKRLYETKTDPGRNWAFEEEFDYAYWAFESFAESEGYAMPENGKLDFRKRVKFKLAMAEDDLSN